LNNLNDVYISDVSTGNILVYNGTNWVNDVSFTGNVTGDVTGSSGSCTGNAATATNASNTTITAVTNNVNYYPSFVSNTSGDLSHNISIDLSYNPQSKTLFSQNFQGNVAQQTILNLSGSTGVNIYPQNGIIDLSGHTFARKNVIQQGMTIDYVTDGSSHDLSTNDILFGFTHICSSDSAMTLTVPSLSDVLSAVDANTGISSLSTGTVFPLSYIVNNSGNKNITVDTSDTFITIYNGIINASTNATFTYMMTGDASAAIIIT